MCMVSCCLCAVYHLVSFHRMFLSHITAKITSSIRGFVILLHNDKCTSQPNSQCTYSNQIATVIRCSFMNHDWI